VRIVLRELITELERWERHPFRVCGFDHTLEEHGHILWEWLKLMEPSFMRSAPDYSNEWTLKICSRERPIMASVGHGPQPRDADELFPFPHQCKQPTPLSLMSHHDMLRTGKPRNTFHCQQKIMPTCWNVNLRCSAKRFASRYAERIKRTARSGSTLGLFSSRLFVFCLHSFLLDILH